MVHLSLGSCGGGGGGGAWGSWVHRGMGKAQISLGKEADCPLEWGCVSQLAPIRTDKTPGPRRRRGFS